MLVQDITLRTTAAMMCLHKVVSKSDTYVILIFDKGRQDLMIKILGSLVYLLRFAS